MSTTSFAEKIKVFFSAIGDFLLPFLHQFLSAAGNAVLQSAQKAVIAVAADTSLLTDADKRSKAASIILNDLEAQGLTIGISTINGAIEAAVAKMKADTDTPAAATTTTPTNDTPSNVTS